MAKMIKEGKEKEERGGKDQVFNSQVVQCKRQQYEGIAPGCEDLDIVPVGLTTTMGIPSIRLIGDVRTLFWKRTLK